MIYDSKTTIFFNTGEEVVVMIRVVCCVGRACTLWAFESSPEKLQSEKYNSSSEMVNERIAEILYRHSK
jgi:hypothetical protein